MMEENKEKILFVIHALGGGGAEKVLVTLANGLAAKGYAVTVMTIVDSGLHRNDLSRNVEYRTLFRMPRKSPRGAGQNGNVSGSLLAGKSSFKSLVAKAYTIFWKLVPASILYRLSVHESYDIEIAYLEGICTKFVASSTNGKSKKIAWVHVDVESEGKSHAVFASRATEERAYSRFNSIACVSQGVMRAMASMFPGLRERLTVVRNPIDVSEIRAKADESLPAQFSKAYSEYTFCAIGRLCSQKAFDRLIRASALVKQQSDSSFSVVVLGEGPLEAELKRMVDEDGLHETVHFIGYQRNPYPFIAHANAFICTSIAEGMSTTVSEAMVLGLPVLSTPCSGTDELFEAGEMVLMGERDEEIAEAMLYAIDRHQIKSGSQKERVSRFFNLNDSIEKIEEFLQDA